MFIIIPLIITATEVLDRILPEGHITERLRTTELGNC